MGLLIGFLMHTGARRHEVLTAEWQHINLERGSWYVAVTKNGRPHIAPLTDRCMEELSRLRRGHPNELVFASYRNDGPFNYRTLWGKVCKEAGYEGRTFHWLRHGCGSALATAGVSQAQIMQVMGHRTLVASARYMHSNVNDRQAVVGRVFK